MKEISISFDMEGKRYKLFIERKMFCYRVYLFQELEGGLLRTVKVEEVSVSKLMDGIRHRLMRIKQGLCQKMKKKSRRGEKNGKIARIHEEN